MSRTWKLLPLFFFMLLFGVETNASGPVIKKVLPQLVDSKGRVALSPSLYERDAYQFYLRNHPEERAGLRFSILWSGVDKEKSLRLRVEMRGLKNELMRLETLEGPVKKTGWFRSWSFPTLSGATYQNFGELVAWRVTLWDGEKKVAEQKSFLW